MSAGEARRQPVRVYSVQEAAVRVRRKVRTIERWIHEGLPVKITRNTNGTVIKREISEEDLLKHLQEKFKSNPSVGTAAAVERRLTDKHTSGSLHR